MRALRWNWGGGFVKDGAELAAGAAPFGAEAKRGAACVWGALQCGAQHGGKCFIGGGHGFCGAGRSMQKFFSSPSRVRSTQTEGEGRVGVRRIAAAMRRGCLALVQTPHARLAAARVPLTLHPLPLSGAMNRAPTGGGGEGIGFLWPAAFIFLPVWCSCRLYEPAMKFFSLQYQQARR